MRNFLRGLLHLGVRPQTPPAEHPPLQGRRAPVVQESEQAFIKSSPATLRPATRAEPLAEPATPSEPAVPAEPAVAREPQVFG